MSKRKIVKIDEEKCTGCGFCVPNCAEGALRIVDGKARLVKDIYCDGLGACLGHCPEGAISIEERDAKDFDKEAAERYLKKEAKKKSKDLPCGCPGTAVQTFNKSFSAGAPCRQTKGVSELTNWPVQLKLVPVGGPYLKGADLLIAADCVAFAYPEFHQDFLKGRILLVGCPKLDEADVYVEKLSGIFKSAGLKSLTIVHMEVPCCFGLKNIIDEALSLSGKEIPYEEITVGIKGDIK
ncbi:MAG: 4Fe-4S dicluster domain-containing protein [Candidatus Omnitrophota bacterium]